jgi:uncharacterized protein YceK
MRKNIIDLTFIPMLTIALAGCSSIHQGPHGGHTVSWYLHHQKKMSQEVSWCKNSVDRNNLESCKNAKTASGKALEFNAKKALHDVGKELS